MECNGADIFDLDFLRDLDQVSIIPVNHDVTPTNDVTKAEPVNPSATEIGLAGKAEQKPRDEWITLNVGGTRFLTCRSTLVMNAAQTGMLVSRVARSGYFKLFGKTGGNVLLREVVPKLFCPKYRYREF